MSIGDAVAPVQKTTMTEISQSFADGFHVVSWGTPSYSDNYCDVQLQLLNVLQETLAVKERIRLTCTEGATMSVKPTTGVGTVLSGDGSEDIIIETDEATGVFDLRVTFSGAGSATVVGGATQGSGFVHCGASVDLSYA